MATRTKSVSEKMAAGLTPYQLVEVRADKKAEEWWRSDGCYIDPDTDDVDWYDKRAELAKMAFIAGFKAATEDQPAKRALKPKEPAK